MDPESLNVLTLSFNFILRPYLIIQDADKNVWILMLIVALLTPTKAGNSKHLTLATCEIKH